MYSASERRKQRRMRGAHVSEEILQIGPRFEHQRTLEFAVDRMFHDHIENPNAMIQKYLKFFFRALGRMLARKDRSVRAIGFRWQAVAGRRRQNVFAARAKNRHVLDKALPADVEVFRDLAARNRPAALAKPRDDLAPPAVRRLFYTRPT